jgi:hypothetical protein
MYGDIHVARRVALGFFPYTHFGVEMPGGGICENSPPGVRIVAYADFARGGPTGVPVVLGKFWSDIPALRLSRGRCRREISRWRSLGRCARSTPRRR